MSSVQFDSALGGDDSIVSDDTDPTTGLRNGGYLTRFVPALTQFIAICNYIFGLMTTAVAAVASLNTYVVNMYTYYNAGNVAALDRENGAYQKWAPTGTKTLTIANWPATGFAEFVIKGIDLYSATITWPTITWVKADGSMTSSFASSGYALTTGVDFVVLWTDTDGVRYGKVVR